MNDREITDQTAFEVAGIPTPPDQEDRGATDMISDAIAGIVDNVEHDLFHDAEGTEETD